MGPAIDIDGLTFTFPDGWHASRYDAWAFYRKQFGAKGTGIKAIDLIAIGPDRCAYLIEAKDYRQHPRSKPAELADEVSQKVRDTLAALLPARLRGNDAAEVAMAKRVLAAEDLKVVLHLEQPEPSRLRRDIVLPATLAKALRERLAAIDKRAQVVDCEHLAGLPWRVK